MKKFIFLFFVFTFLLTNTLATKAFTQGGIVVEPNRLFIESRAGEIVTKRFSVTNANKNPIELRQSFGKDDSKEQVNVDSWIKFSSSNITLAANQTKELEFKATIPKDQPNGAYMALISLSYNIGSVTNSLQIPVFIVLDKEFTLSGDVTEIKQTGNDIYVTVENKGSLYVKVDGEVILHTGNIRNPLQTKLIDSNLVIKPNSSRIFLINFDEKLLNTPDKVITFSGKIRPADPRYSETAFKSIEKSTDLLPEKNIQNKNEIKNYSLLQQIRYIMLMFYELLL